MLYQPVWRTVPGCMHSSCVLWTFLCEPYYPGRRMKSWIPHLPGYLCNSSPTLLHWRDPTPPAQVSFCPLGTKLVFLPILKQWNGSVCGLVPASELRRVERVENLQTFSLPPFSVASWLPVNSAVVLRTLKPGCWSAETEAQVGQQIWVSRDRRRHY